MNTLVQGDLPIHHLLPNEDYVLTIRQAPERAKVAGTKEKDRKPVDPPPIIQLQIRDATDPAHNYLQSPYYFMCCNLSDVNQDPRSPIGNPHLSNSQQQVLAGTLVSSLHRLKDIDNTDGGFFVFGDVSVKIEGEYRLRFSLFEMVRERQEVMYIKSVMSEPFTVYPSRSFPGMNESTFLSRSFGDQGVRLRIRKEPRTLLKRPAPSTLRQDDYHRSYAQQPPPLESRGMPHQGLTLANRGISSQHIDINSRGIPPQPLELASRGITSQGLDLHSRVLPLHPAQPLELNGRGHPPQGLDMSNLSSRLSYSTQEEEESHGNKRQRTSIDASGGTMYGEGPPSRFTDRNIASDHRNAYHHGSERSFEESRGYSAATAAAPERPHYDDHRSSYTTPRAQLPVPQPQTLPTLYPNTTRSLALPENLSQYEQDLRYNERPFDDSRNSNYATRNGPNPAHSMVHRQFGGHSLHSYQPPR